MWGGGGKVFERSMCGFLGMLTRRQDDALSRLRLSSHTTGHLYISSYTCPCDQVAEVASASQGRISQTDEKGNSDEEVDFDVTKQPSVINRPRGIAHREKF